jgi:hypothetical protein
VQPALFLEAPDQPAFGRLVGDFQFDSSARIRPAAVLMKGEAA